MIQWRHAGGDRLAAVERPEPALAGDEVLIEVEAAVVGAPELCAAARLSGAGEAADAPAPGGAAVGRVVAAGENAGHVLGARVALSPHIPCGECELCRRGVAVLCPLGATLGATADGALASHVVGRARWLCRVDGDLEVPGPAAALVAREAADAFAMYVRAGAAPGEPVVVVGDDAVAELLAAVGRARGTRPLRVGAFDDPAAARAAAAEEGLGERPWKLFETGGTGSGRALALALAGPGATVTMLARRPEPTPAPLDLAAAVDRGVTVLGVAGAHPDLLPEVAALAVRGELDLAAVAEEVALDAPDLLARARAAHAGGRVCVAIA